MTNILIVSNSRAIRYDRKVQAIQRLYKGGNLRFKSPGDALTGSVFDIILDFTEVYGMTAMEYDQYQEYQNVMKCRLKPGGILLRL